MKRLSTWVLLACVALGLAPLARGQGQDMLDFGLGGAFGSAEPVEIDARFQLMQGSRQGFLWVKARIQQDWHLYSDKQPSGGPIATELSLVANDVLQLTGPFEADRDPEIHNYPEAFSVPCHEYRGEVIWRAPIQLLEGADPASGELTLRVDGQACKDDVGGLGACQLLDIEAPLTYVAEPFLPVQGETKYSSKIAPELQWTAQADVASVAPGGKVNVAFTATLQPGWHVYELQPKRAESTGNMPTLIVFSKLSGMTVVQTTPDREPLPAKSEDELPNYEKSVTWTVQMTVPADAGTEGSLQLSGLIGYQICTESKCQPPSGARFELTLPLAAATTKGKIDATFADSSYKKANDLANQQAEAKEGESKGNQENAEEVQPLTLASLAGILGLGLLGGLILNAMPCVLPVIGLKILSFVEQAGQSRGRIFLLNLYFSLGLMAVFMVLATLAAFANMAWGELFTKPWFKVTMSATVFVMALSFLGVWEIQIPGMVGGQASHELQQKEGFAGAFFKGVFTTLLATPCSGPFLGALFALAVKYPPAITYLVFGSIGLGMALPYLAIGANPNLVRSLPKPGAWMETFKQIMGFVLLATVVYLFSTLRSVDFVPTFALLVGLWFGCWLIGRVPATAELPTVLRAWVFAGVAAALCGYLGMELFGPHDQGPKDRVLPWEAYSKVALAEAQSEGRTVLVDFTANWCLTCKYNLKTAINTREVRQVVDRNGVVTFLADWTDESEEIKQSLAELNSKSIPLLAIYPAGKPENVIVLRDVITQSQLVDALEKAGPSLDVANPRATVMQ